MEIGKKEREEVRFVKGLNDKYPVGIDVIVKKDDGTEQGTKTRSAAWMLGSCRDYPGHTVVIMLDGIPGCYALDRVREVKNNDENLYTPYKI